MRPELLQPNGELTDEVLADMLAIAGAPVTAGRISQWAPLERAIAYDWAAREYLHASDNPVRRRPRPSLLGESEARA